MTVMEMQAAMILGRRVMMPSPTPPLRPPYGSTISLASSAR